jgi:hypothetical protein
MAFYNNKSMSRDMNLYAFGQRLNADYHANQQVNNYSDFALRHSTTKNMDILLESFHKNESYPVYYLGIAKKMAICRCPITGEEEWFNVLSHRVCLSIEKPKKGSTITVTLKDLDKIYSREFLFMGWSNYPVHEWCMTNGNTLQLSQSFVNGLSSQDKRYLKMNH